VARIWSAEETRKASRQICARAFQGHSDLVSVNRAGLERAAGAVIAALRGSYPELQVPPASVWRSFEAGDADRWAILADARGFTSQEDFLAVAADLALLAGAVSVNPPGDWLYEDALTGQGYGGPAGVHLALLAMVRSGVFSADPADPLRVDAHALIRLDNAEVVAGLGLSPGHQAEWGEALTGYLRRFGETIGMRPDVFEADGAVRPGHLAAGFARDGGEGAVCLPELFAKIAEDFAPLWAGGAGLREMILGDVWQPADADPEADGVLAMTPFHLPASTMASSLIEPCVWSGLDLSGYDGLPGPSDAAHAALLQQFGVLELRESHTGADAAARMIELRAVTSGLWGSLAQEVRQKLEVDEDTLPDPCMLEATQLAAGAIMQKKSTEFHQLAKFMNPGSVFWLPFGA